jgi:hypothetical protein
MKRERTKIKRIHFVTSSTPLQWPKRTYSSYEKGYAAKQTSITKSTNSSSTIASQNVASNHSQPNLFFNFSSTPLPGVDDHSVLTSRSTNELLNLSSSSNNSETFIKKRNDSISQYESDNRLIISKSSINVESSAAALPKLAAAQHKHQSPPMRIPAVHARITKFDLEPRPGLFESLMSTFGINMCPQVPPDLGKLFIEHSFLSIISNNRFKQMGQSRWTRSTRNWQSWRLGSHHVFKRADGIGPQSVSPVIVWPLWYHTETANSICQFFLRISTCSS